MTEVVPHSDNGYGWSMDDSARLRAEVDRRAAERAAALRRGAIKQTVADLARRHGGVDPALLDMTNPKNRERADRLLADKETQLHRERVEKQAEILLSRLPVRYRSAVLPATEWARDALEWLRDYRRAYESGAPQPGLVIMGPKGTGKTWCAAALTRILLTEDTIPVTFITMQRMIESVKPAQNGLDVDMIQFEAAPLLVLDDFGAERQTEFAMDQLLRLADSRAANARPTVVTTNLDGPGLRRRYDAVDERIVDRLFGGAKLIKIAGASRRNVPF